MKSVRRVLSNKSLQSICETTLNEIRAANLYKNEYVITSPQKASISVANNQQKMLNFCANNYLGLASHPDIVQGAIDAVRARGAGMSSVRFICGTQDIHKDLEKSISSYLEREDTILYPSCFDANGGVFECLLNKEDAVISDELNHASIIDGIRLCKAEKHRYKHLDLANLEEILKKTQDKRIRFIVTDGVFSMDGDLAPLDKICALAEKYDAAVMVDDCHASGFIGKAGKGTPHYFDVVKQVDVLHSTLGKALGGASGGFSSGSAAMVALQRQRSRPYLFSNALPPAVVGASQAAVNLLSGGSGNNFQEQIQSNVKLFRGRMKKAGFTILGHDTVPIAPVLLKDAGVAVKMAKAMLDQGIYVIAFSYPVVPNGLARIRVQLSAAHSEEDVNRAVDAFIAVGKQLAVIQ